MKNTTKILLMIISMLTITMVTSQCKKDPSPDSPPSPPPEKNNYFVAKVDGKDWKTCGPITAPWLTAQYFQNNYFDIEGKNTCETINSYIYMKIFNLNDTGYYILGGNTQNIGEYYYYTSSSGIPIEYKTNTFYTGTSYITKFDTAAKKISGTFQFSAFNVDSNKIISITNGDMENITFY